MKKIAINGFGRIGRLTFRTLFANKKLDIVAINDLADAKTLATLLEYDSAQGKWMHGKISVSADKKSITVDGKVIKIFSEREIKDLPWGKLGIDVVVESTGLFTQKKKQKSMLNLELKKL